jgi:hypothetical protein
MMKSVYVPIVEGDIYEEVRVIYLRPVKEKTNDNLLDERNKKEEQKDTFNRGVSNYFRSSLSNSEYNKYLKDKYLDPRD